VSENGNPLILVADDDEDILMLVAVRLGRAGYTVVTARDGEEAVQVAIDRRPDLAVLDVMMPHLDGYEATPRLRGHAETSRMPIILLTARVQEADIARGIEAGADDLRHEAVQPAGARCAGAGRSRPQLIEPLRGLGYAGGR
jgi:DNA-binding response OmpR family regulator